MTNLPEIMQEINRVSNVKTMSSREIAELTGKMHKNVLVDIERILEDAEIDRLRFQHIYLDTYKREQREYRLPYREALLVTSGYDTKQRLKIIDRWAELEVEKRQQPKASKLPSATTLMKLQKHFEELAQRAGLKENQLLLATNRGVAKLTGFNQLEAMDIKHIPAPDNDEYVTPTVISEKLDPVMRPKPLNIWLTDLGLQIPKHTKKGFIPTPKGEALGGNMCDVPLQHVEGSTQSLKWNLSILVPYLQELLDNNQEERK